MVTYMHKCGIQEIDEGLLTSGCSEGGKVVSKKDGDPKENEPSKEEEPSDQQGQVTVPDLRSRSLPVVLKPHLGQSLSEIQSVIQRHIQDKILSTAEADARRRSTPPD